MKPSAKGKASSGDLFRRFANWASHLFGTHWAFVIAFGTVLLWAASGPLLEFSERWQLVINTVTTIVTFLMVFLIQSTQNREARATQLKLDELIRASQARNVFADLEDASDEELAAFQREFRELRQRGLSGKDAIAEAHSSVWDGDGEGQGGESDDERADEDENGGKPASKRAREESSTDR